MKMDEEHKLSAYLDGELSESERLALRSQLEQDSALRSELEELRAVKGEVTSWLRERSDHELNLWPALEKEIRNRQQRFSVGDFLRSLSDLRVGSFAVGFACAMLLVFFVDRFGGTTSSTQTAGNYQLPVSGERPVALQGPVVLGGPIYPVVARNMMRDRGVNREPAVRPVSGGYRTNGADIEWIKSDKNFRLVPSRQRNTPPVIWLVKDQQPAE